MVLKHLTNKKFFFLGDFNINLLKNNCEYALNSKVISESPQRQYKDFCTSQGLHQLIIEPTRISNNTSTLLDHILTNVYEKTSQSGIIDVGLSDHRLIFCTRKLIKQKKIGKHKMIKIRQMKNYTSELFLDELDKTNFPDYSQYEDVHRAYSHFSDKLSSVRERISPNKEVRIKNDNQEWFDGEVLEKIRIRDKLFTKYKKSRLHVDKDIYHNAINVAHSLILKKEKRACTRSLTR